MDVKPRESTPGRHERDQDNENYSVSSDSDISTEADELDHDADDKISSDSKKNQYDLTGSDICEIEEDDPKHDLPSEVDIKSEPTDDYELEQGDALPPASEPEEWEGPGNELVPVPLNLIPAEGNQGLLRIDVEDPLHPVPSGPVNVKEEQPEEDIESSLYSLDEVAAAIDHNMEPNPTEDHSASSIDKSGEIKTLGPIKGLSKAVKVKKSATKGCLKVAKSQRCDQCDKAFVYPSELARHKLIHSGVRRHACGQCDKMFKLPGDLKAHQRLHTGERPYACDQCHKTYKKRFTLTEHKRIHAGVRPYKCDQCNKAFTRSHDVSLHKLTNHSTEKPFSCDQCDKEFKRSGDLKKHKYVHTGERPFTCGKCGKSFKQSSALALHKSIHTEERLFTCDQCGKSFKQSSALARHKHIHTEERLFTCDQCEMVFKQSSALAQHKHIHTEETSFVCTLMCNKCDRIFPRSNLYQHEQRPFTCGECDKAFKNSPALALHIGAHSKETSFACDECDKTFTKRSSLYQHECVHDNERPLLCDECGKIFLQRCILNEHKRIIHPAIKA
ncbi:zinc finger protein ZFP2-like isoform X3 [Lineus longissimus]|uniref:zinc finger protein ZFP2-like isoform X3 n=1 Tax=Lineus longissimus TaxID=88925 RepID=UPI002B4DF6F7